MKEEDCLGGAFRGRKPGLRAGIAQGRPRPPDPGKEEK